jgi:hypothetical protein
MSRITFLPTSSEKSLWDLLVPRFAKASSLKIGSAFLGGEDQIISWLSKDKKRRAEILVRLECPTNPWTVQRLIRHPQVKIRAARSERHYHEKIFIALSQASKPLGAYIGSANWTQYGLERNDEAGVWLAIRPTLQKMVDHFNAGMAASVAISNQMLKELHADSVWERSHGPRPRRKDPKQTPPWAGVRASESGKYLLKQNGTADWPFEDGIDNWSEFSRDTSAQTISRIPSTFDRGIGVILCRIAKRANGRPDRMIYGRGLIGDFDRKRWRLPKKYLMRLLRRPGIDPGKVNHMKQWPEVLWLDDPEFIDYPDRCKNFLWLGDFIKQPYFQGGFRWMTPSAWTSCTAAIEDRIRKYGKQSFGPGIWWNDFLGIEDPKDPLFMTKIRIERLTSQ